MSSVFILRIIHKNAFHRIPFKSHLEEFDVSYCSWIISWFGTRRSLPRRGLWLWWSVCVTLVCKCQQWFMVCQCVSVELSSSRKGVSDSWEWPLHINICLPHNIRPWRHRQLEADANLLYTDNTRLAGERGRARPQPGRLEDYYITLPGQIFVTNIRCPISWTKCFLTNSEQFEVKNTNTGGFYVGDILWSFIKYENEERLP